MDNNIQSILKSLIDSKETYIEVRDQNGKPLFKLMLLVIDNELVELLDSFFDNGYKIEQITKQNFDNFSGKTHTFNY